MSRYSYALPVSDNSDSMLCSTALLKYLYGKLAITQDSNLLSTGTRIAKRNPDAIEALSPDHRLRSLIINLICSGTANGSLNKPRVRLASLSFAYCKTNPQSRLCYHNQHPFRWIFDTVWSRSIVPLFKPTHPKTSLDKQTLHRPCQSVNHKIRGTVG